MNTKENEDQEQILISVLEALTNFASTQTNKEKASKNIVSEMELTEKNQKGSLYEDIINKLDSLYKNDTYRHSYSTISRFIIDKKNSLLKDSSKQQIEEALWQNMASKIEIIYKEAKEKEYKHIARLFKLRDHINLEIVRMSDSTNIQLDIERQITNAKNSLEEFEKTSKNIQKDYITILGIFAAIVLAFISGLVFSSSVLQNIDKPNTFKLVSIICFLGVFIVNILNLLFNFIREIHFSKQEQSNTCSIWAFNIIIISIAIVCLIGSFEYDEKTRITGENNSTINVNTANISFSPIR